MSTSELESKSTTDELTNIRTVVEGTFASKDTKRVSSVMADGLGFVRETAESLVEETRISEKAPVILLAIRIAEWAETKLRAFSGGEKKKMVLELLEWSIENQEDVLFNILGENKDELQSLVKNVIPSVLDVVVAASRGQLELNKVVKVSKSCLTWCLGKKNV
jgi:hypothetical protein